MGFVLECKNHIIKVFYRHLKKKTPTLFELVTNTPDTALEYNENLISLVEMKELQTAADMKVRKTFAWDSLDNLVYFPYLFGAIFKLQTTDEKLTYNPLTGLMDNNSHCTAKSISWMVQSLLDGSIIPKNDIMGLISEFIKVRRNIESNCRLALHHVYKLRKIPHQKNLIPESLPLSFFRK
jgi:hypothetical protein